MGCSSLTDETMDSAPPLCMLSFDYTRSMLTDYRFITLVLIVAFAVWTAYHWRRQ
jgi:hypothetical protein